MYGFCTLKNIYTYCDHDKIFNILNTTIQVYYTTNRTIAHPSNIQKCTSFEHSCYYTSKMCTSKIFTNITTDIISIGGANLKSCVQMTNGIPKTHAKKHTILCFFKTGAAPSEPSILHTMLNNSTHRSAMLAVTALLNTNSALMTFCCCKGCTKSFSFAIQSMWVCASMCSITEGGRIQKKCRVLWDI